METNVRDLPVTDKMVARPVELRLRRRLDLEPMLPPTDDEKSDALHVLAEADETHPLYLEACRIWHEGSVPFAGRTPESLQAERYLLQYVPLLHQLGRLALEEWGDYSTSEEDTLWLALLASGEPILNRTRVIVSDVTESIRRV